MYNKNALKVILENIKNKSETNTEKGTAFERLIQCYLKYDKKFTKTFNTVELNREYYKRIGQNINTEGMDIIATIPDSNQLVGIQCKFHAKSINDRQLTTFYKNANHSKFAYCMLAYIKKSDDNKDSKKRPDKIHEISLYDLENSSIDWSAYIKDKGAIKQKQPKELRPYQLEAIQAIKKGFQKDTRGKLILPCGTGKTFISVKFIESFCNDGDIIMYCVPSIALMKQVLESYIKEHDQSISDISYISICSDSTVGKKDDYTYDNIQMNIAEKKQFRVSTEPEVIRGAIKKFHESLMHNSEQKRFMVIFSTYQSLDQFSSCQKDYGNNDQNNIFKPIKLIICDEAHRTTGASKDDNHTGFKKIHNNDYINAEYRLYMTATPRIYSEKAKKATESNIEIYSMDDEKTYGKELYYMTFKDAIEQGYLSDYKVMIMDVHINEMLNMLKTHNIKFDEHDKKAIEVRNDAIKALAMCLCCNKIKHINELERNIKLLAFWKTIKSSERIASDEVYEKIKEFMNKEPKDTAYSDIQINHIDGTQDAAERSRKIRILEQDSNNDIIQMITNARCLSEGVDIPQLDAIAFLDQKNSKVDIIQAVGRVMRKHENKKRGYIIIPVFIDNTVIKESLLAGQAEEEIAREIVKTSYNTVWKVIQALRSHDKRIDDEINRIALNPNSNEKLSFVERYNATQEINNHNQQEENHGSDYHKSLAFNSISNSMDKHMRAHIIDTNSNDYYWGNWVKSLTDALNELIARLSEERYHVDIADLHKKVLRISIASLTFEQTIEFLSQNIVFSKIIDALYGSSYLFSENNDISKFLTKFIENMNADQNLSNALERVNNICNNAKKIIENIGLNDTYAKKELMIKIYNNFFTIYESDADKFGIVYTPQSAVDFMINSIADLTKEYFGYSISELAERDEINIIDPFAGTGAFITSLLENQEIIPYPSDIINIYNKIYTTEILLLPYFIHTCMIEQIHHKRTGSYVKFENSVLSDTFQMYNEKASAGRDQNEGSNRTVTIDDAYKQYAHLKPRENQKNNKYNIIIANPPYRAGQKSANDNRPNEKYDILDHEIKEAFSYTSKSTGTGSVHNSYIKALYIASKNISNNAIICMITPNSFLYNESCDGLRGWINKTFDYTYIIDLRGNRLLSSSDARSKEGASFFDKSQLGISINIFVKKDGCDEHIVKRYDIGDKLKTKEKHNQLYELKSIRNIDDWSILTLDKNNDWMNHRNPIWEKYMVLGDKKQCKDNQKSIFKNYTNGISTGRDAWSYNFHNQALSTNMQIMIDWYNKYRIAYWENREHNKANKDHAKIKDYLHNNNGYDNTKISWAREILNRFASNKNIILDKSHIIKSLYRPFIKSYFYYHSDTTEMVYQMDAIFPIDNHDVNNKLILLPGKSASSCTPWIVDCVFDLHAISEYQGFPLYIYENVNGGELIASKKERDYAITDYAHKHFAYDNYQPSKEDIFYYVYGLTNSKDFQNSFQENLGKEFPTIPKVNDAKLFQEFSVIGRKLADLHLKYEYIDIPHDMDGIIINGENMNYGSFLHYIKENNIDKAKYFYINKMKCQKSSDKENAKLIFNNNITIDIPSMEFNISGHHPLKYLALNLGSNTSEKTEAKMESGIINDANNFAPYAMYYFDLALKLIQMSIQTIDIVDNMPKWSHDICDK